MNKTLLAIILWVIQTHSISPSRFMRNAKGIWHTYTDPTDPLLYCPSILKQSYVQAFTDYIVFYAELHVNSGIKSYGWLDKYLRYEVGT